MDSSKNSCVCDLSTTHVLALPSRHFSKMTHQVPDTLWRLIDWDSLHGVEFPFRYVPGNLHWSLTDHIAKEIRKRRPSDHAIERTLPNFEVKKEKLHKRSWGLQRLKDAVSDAEKKKRAIDDVLLDVADQVAKNVVDDMEISGELDRFMHENDLSSKPVRPKRVRRE